MTLDNHKLHGVKLLRIAAIDGLSVTLTESQVSEAINYTIDAEMRIRALKGMNSELLDRLAVAKKALDECNDR